MTFASSPVRHCLVGLTIALAVGAIAPAAQAHRISRIRTAEIIENSSYRGHCGNGTFSYCYGTFTPSVDRTYGRHGYRWFGGWQERRGLKLYGCLAHGVTSHTQFFFWDESCFRL